MNPSSAVASPRLARLAFAAMLAVYGFSFFHRTAVPGTIFNELQQELNLSASAIVALGSVFLWVYGSMQLVAGIAVDRWGGTRMLLWGGFFAAAGAILFPLADTPGRLYLSRAIAAFGDSFIYLAILKEVHLLFSPRRFPALIGVAQFAGLAGGMLAMLPFERATHFFGWRHALLAMGSLMAIGVVANFLVLPKLKHFVPHTTAFTLLPVWEILGNRRNWPIFVSGFINFPVYFVLQVGVGKKFLQDFVGLSSRQAATFTLIMMTASATLCLASGFLLHQTGGRRKPYLVGAASLVLGAAGLLLAGVLCHAGAWLFLTGYILLALSNIAGPISTTMMKELNDSRHVAQALAVVNALAYFGVAVLLMVSGAVLDLFQAGAEKTATGLIIYPAHAYAMLFAIFTGLAVITLTATGFLQETHGTHSSGWPTSPENPFRVTDLQRGPP